MNSCTCWPAYERTLSARPGKGKVPAASHCTSSVVSPWLVSALVTISTSLASSSFNVTSTRSAAVVSVRCSVTACAGTSHSTSQWVNAWANCWPSRCASKALWPNQPTPKLGTSVSGWSNSSMNEGSGRVSRSGRRGVAPSDRRGPQ